MGIGMNAIGNYSPNNIANTSRQAKVKQTAAGGAEVNASQSSGKIQQAKQDSLLPEEKDFFAKLYPQNKAEVADYHFYERSGKLSGVKLGSLIDRRG